VRVSLEFALGQSLCGQRGEVNLSETDDATATGGNAPRADSGGGWKRPAQPLTPGLHFIATPIGAARDITLRALDILAGAEVLAAEDTRSLRHLMDIHGIALGGRPLIAYHDHNGAAVRPRLLRALAEGKASSMRPRPERHWLPIQGINWHARQSTRGIRCLPRPGRRPCWRR
jgi:hypothetical protein